MSVRTCVCVCVCVMLTQFVKHRTELAAAAMLWLYIAMHSRCASEREREEEGGTVGSSDLLAATNACLFFHRTYRTAGHNTTTHHQLTHTHSSKMSSRKTAGRRATTKKRAQRATSNVFAMFDQAQIAEFKEAFNMIDQNRDGFVEKEDLHDMLASLGKNPTDDYLDGMMNEAPGPINFTMFLTLFGERLQGTDPEDVIKNAFGCFDEENMGVLPEDRLRELLTTMGDRFTDEDVSCSTGNRTERTVQTIV